MSDLASQIVKALKNYSKEVEKTVQKEIQKTAKDAVSELKQKSPKRTGKYAAGWRVNKRKNQYIINNKDRPSLTHLLENGHVGRDGKRWVDGQPHIKPVEEMVDEIVDRIKKQL